MATADDLWPQDDLEAELRRLSSLLDQATRKIQVRALRAARAESAYKRRYALEFMASQERSAAAREQQAMACCADLYDERKIAEAVLISAQEAARNLRAQMSAMQSINSNHRAMVG